MIADLASFVLVMLALIVVVAVITAVALLVVGLVRHWRTRR